MSHAKFFCHFCGHSGPRAECKVELPGEVPGFNDVCPRCTRDDVDVYDGRHTREAFGEEGPLPRHFPDFSNIARDDRRERVAAKKGRWADIEHKDLT